MDRKRINDILSYLFRKVAVKMKAWIIYNGFLPGDKFFDFAYMLKSAASHFGHDAKIVSNNEIVNSLFQENKVFFEINRPDYILFTDKDIYLAKQLEMLGIPVFNSADTIEISDDKIKTYQQLRKDNVPIPNTIIAPKTFGIPSSLHKEYIDSVIELLGFPLIMKEAFGSFGEQVYFIQDRHQLKQYIQKLSNVPYVFQQYINSSYGKDLRLQVVGDEVVCAMFRQSESDFRANITNGGKMFPYEPSELEREVAITASKAIGADFSGVDLLFGDNGNPIVCEVNSNAHIRNILNCTGINAAEYIISYIDQKIKEQHTI